MMHPWLQILPVFIYKRLALRLCCLTTVQKTQFAQAAPDILIKVKT